MTDLETSLSKIDLVAMITQDLGQPRQKSSRWSLWLCPFHPDKKTPSLGVNRENGSWYCFGCSKGGNAISWLCTYHRLGLNEALAVLGLSDYRYQERKGNTSIPKGSQVDQGTETNPPPELWQKRGLAFLAYARNQLWRTPSAEAYLHEKRLLQDTTIQHFGLGYNPSELWDRPDRWGLSNEAGKRVWLPKGYVIPCFVEKSLWYIKIRQVEKEPKYIHVRGSVPAMFGAASLLGTPLVLLTEGEFDCMLTWQCLKDVAGVATLGSANKKLDVSRWMRHLLPAEEIIAVLDNDSAGKQGAQNLAGISAQIHPVRIPSLTSNGKDITDFVQAGGDLWEWLKHQLVRIEIHNSH